MFNQRGLFSGEEALDGEKRGRKYKLIKVAEKKEEGRGQSGLRRGGNLLYGETLIYKGDTFEGKKVSKTKRGIHRKKKKRGEESQPIMKKKSSRETYFGKKKDKRKARRFHRGLREKKKVFHRY